MLAKMKASTEQELEKKTADFERKPAPSGDRKQSIVERKGSVSEKRRNSVAPMPKKPATGNKAAQQMGHSLTGMLATKKFFKRFSKRERTSSTVTVPPKEYEPTYRMVPKRKFNSQHVHEVIKKLVDDKLDKMIYSKKWSPNLTKILCNQIKEKAKTLNYERYKMICNVTLGENKGPGIMATSRCSWDHRTDDYATYTFQSKHLYCTVVVFGVYKE